MWEGPEDNKFPKAIRNIYIAEKISVAVTVNQNSHQEILLEAKLPEVHTPDSHAWILDISEGLQ